MEKPYHVLLDCERMKYPYTGLYYYCLHLGRALVQAIGENKSISFYIPPKENKAFGVTANYIQQNSSHKFLLPPTQVFSLWHSTYQGTNYFPWRRKLKILFTIHDLNFMYQSKGASKKKKYLNSLKSKVERADHIVAISEFTLNDLKQHIDVGDKPCTVIYNGCTINEISNLETPRHAPSTPFFFTIGTIVEKKNFHVLPSLLLNNDFSLIIAGITQDETYKSLIVSEAKKLGVDGRLIFTGSISENDKQWYLKNCAAFAFPSISEGFGLPVIEAMHFGKPVLLSTSTSLPEIGGDEAYYFQNFDPDYMNKLANTAINEHTVAKAEKIRNWANRFSWEASAQQYLGLYSKLLE